MISFLDFVARLGVVLTPAQRVLAMVAFDGVRPRDLRGSERRLARVLFGEVDEVPPQLASVLVLVCGARSGKSYLSALRLLHLAFVVDLSRLAPGEVAAGLLVAPDLRLARQALRYAIGACKLAPLGRWLVSDSADSILINRPDGRRVSIEALPATRGGSAVRGRSLVGALLDESAFFLDEAGGYIVADAELFRAISPRVVQGGQTLIASTPWTRSGLLFDLWSENFGKPSTALAAHAPTLLMRHDAPEVVAVVERERRRDPANAAREYDASFVDSSASLLASEDVEACRDRGVTNRPPREGVVYALTVDVGLRNDSTVATVGHVESRGRDNAPSTRVLVVDAVVILKPTPLKRVTIEQVEEAVAALATRYRCPAVHGDLHMADALGPRLAARGIKYVELSMSPSAQQTRGKTMAAMFSARAVQLVDEPTLVRELKELKVTRHAGGRVSVGALGSRHDDAADTLLLLTEVQASLPECGGDAGRVEYRFQGATWGDDGVSVKGRYVRVLENGREIPAEVPRWSPDFEEYAESAESQGFTTPAIEAWKRERREQGPSISVPVDNEGGGPARPGFEWGKRDSGDGRQGWAFGKK